LASEVRLSSDAVLNGVDIVLQKAQTADVHLHVSSPVGSLKDEVVTVMRGINDVSRIEYGEGCCLTERLDDEGRLVLRRVPAGSYVLNLSATVGTRELEGSANIVVRGSEEAMVDVSLVPRMNLSVKVTREGWPETGNQDRQQPPKLVLTPLNDITQRTAAGAADRNNEIQIKDVKPGLYHWAVNGLDSNQYAELWANGQKLPGDILKVAGGGPTDLELRVENGAASLIVEPEGEQEYCVGVFLIVLPSEPQQQPRSFDYPRGGGCRFTARGLRPGKYDVALVRLMEQGEMWAPSFRSKLSEVERIIAHPGESAFRTVAIQTLSHDY